MQHVNNQNTNFNDKINEDQSTTNTETNNDASQESRYKIDENTQSATSKMFKFMHRIHRPFPEGEGP